VEEGRRRHTDLRLQIRTAEADGDQNRNPAAGPRRPVEIGHPGPRQGSRSRPLRTNWTNGAENIGLSRLSAPGGTAGPRPARKVLVGKRQKKPTAYPVLGTDALPPLRSTPSGRLQRWPQVYEWMALRPPRRGPTPNRGADTDASNAAGQYQQLGARLRSQTVPSDKK